MSLVEKTMGGVSQADVDESYRRFPGGQGPARYGFLEGIRRERKACAKLADLQAALDRRKGEAFAKALDDDGVAQSYEDFAVTAESIAKAIRFRSEL